MRACVPCPAILAPHADPLFPVTISYSLSLSPSLSAVSQNQLSQQWKEIEQLQRSCFENDMKLSNSWKCDPSV